MRDLVPFANHLAEVTGSPAAASQLSREMGRSGLRALPRVGGDLRWYLEEQAVALGLVDDSGSPDADRCGQLVIVCDILAQVPVPADPPDPQRLLVFTVPPEARGLLQPRQRLDLLVERLVRMANVDLHIGGPFWNDPGFDRLLRVLKPAAEERGVQCIFYVHSWPDRERQEFLLNHIGQIGTANQVTIWWYRGAAESLMHAKFIVKDSLAGYLGTANLTSYGMEQHVELGLELNQEQARDLLRFLKALIGAELFMRAPPATPPTEVHTSGHD